MAKNIEKVDFFRSRLHELSLCLGAVDAIFIIDFIEPRDWLGKNWLNNFKARNSLLCSSGQIHYLFSRSRSCMTTLDPDFIKATQKPAHVWLSSTGLKQQQLKASFLNELGYGKQISISLPLSNFNGLQGCYSFFYSSYNQLSDIERLNLLQGKKAELEMMATYIASERVIAGPLEDYQVFKPSTISIIRHLAEGYSRKDLSSLHHMSSRGVDYHIEKAKVRLGAQSSSHLVHIAHNMMLIG